MYGDILTSIDIYVYFVKYSHHYLVGVDEKFHCYSMYVKIFTLTVVLYANTEYTH